MSDDDRDHAEILACNEAFYRAFRDRDLDAMARLWAEHAPIACMHPGMDVVTGRERVLDSWRGILSHPESPTIECSRVEIHILGESAFVTCLEGSPQSRPTLIATNVFTREDGRFKMVHHHGAPLAPAAVRRTRPPPPQTPVN